MSMSASIGKFLLVMLAIVFVIQLAPVSEYVDSTEIQGAQSNTNENTTTGTPSKGNITSETQHRVTDTNHTAGETAEEPTENTTNTHEDTSDTDNSAESIHFVVGVNQSMSTPDITPAVRQATTFWEARSPEYNETYNATFAVRPNATNPDIVVSDFLPDKCGHNISGCADTVDSPSVARQIDEPINVHLRPDGISNKRNLVYTTKHEFGHALGAPHCVQPYWLLGCPETAAYENKSYKTAESPWRASNIRVYVDADESVRPIVTNVLDTYRESENIPSNMTIETVTTEWRADIVVSASLCSSDDYVTIEPSIQGGQAYDSDGDFEFLYGADIRVTAPSERILDAALGRGLGAVLTPTDYPTPYQNADSE